MLLSSELFIIVVSAARPSPDNATAIEGVLCVRIHCASGHESNLTLYIRAL
jgi:hypothetical protein